MKERLNKLLALVMTFMMLFSSLPVDTLAEAIDNASVGAQVFANSNGRSAEEQAFLDAGGSIDLPCRVYPSLRSLGSTVTYTVPYGDESSDRNYGMWDGNRRGDILSTPSVIGEYKRLFDGKPAAFVQYNTADTTPSDLAQYRSNPKSEWDYGFIYSTQGEAVHGNISLYWNQNTDDPHYYRGGAYGSSSGYSEIEWDEFYGYIKNFYVPYYSETNRGTYEDTFVSDGEVIETRYYNGGDTFNVPTPSKDGYEFVGWIDDATGKLWSGGAEYRQPTADVIFTAQWRPSNGMVLLDPNGGTWSGGSTTLMLVTVETANDMMNSAATDPASISYAGHTFKAWEKVTQNSDGSKTTTRVTSSKAGDVIRAVWNEATVTFDLNGGTGTAPAEMTVAAGTTIYMPEMTEGVTNPEGEFVGWSTTPNANRAIIDVNDKALPMVYYPGDRFTVEGDTTLYAVWASTSLTQATHVQFAIYPTINSQPFEPQIQTGTYVVVVGDSDVRNPFDYFKRLVSIYNSDSRIRENFGPSAPSDNEAIQKYREKYGLEGDNSDYEVVWYVMKYQQMIDEYQNVQQGQYCIYVDGYIRKKGLITLNYDVNAPYTEVTGRVPNGISKESGSWFEVYAFDGNDYANNHLQRPNYIFLGWSFDPDATTPDFAVNGESNVTNPGGVTLSESDTLYAVWQKNYEDRLDITVSKEWYDEDGNQITGDALEGLTATFELQRCVPSEWYETYTTVATLESVGGADVTFADRSVYVVDEIDGTKYKYRVVETSCTDGYALDGEVVNDTPEGEHNLHFTAKNKETEKLYELQLKKILADAAFYPFGNKVSLSFTISGDKLVGRKMNWSNIKGVTSFSGTDSADICTSGTITLTFSSEEHITVFLPEGEYTVSEIAISDASLDDFNTRVYTKTNTAAGASPFNEHQKEAIEAAKSGQDQKSITIKLGGENGNVGLLFINADDGKSASFTKTVPAGENEADTFEFELKATGPDHAPFIEGAQAVTGATIKEIKDNGYTLVLTGVKPNEKVTIEHLVDATYTLTELGYYVNGTGEMIAIGSDASKYAVPGDGTLTLDGEITFTNSYKEAPAEYTVTYKYIGDVPDNVTSPSDETRYADQATVTVKPTPTGAEIPDDYTFEGWYVEENGEPNKEKKYATDETFTISGDVTLVGIWRKTISITATKKWDDNDNQDGKRANVTLVLCANNAKVEDSERAIAADATGDALTVTWENLPYSDENYNKITYTVQEETALKDYNSIVTGDADNGFIVTNSHTAETLDITVEKVWEDENNAGGTRPSIVTLSLLADGEAVQEITMSDRVGWEKTWYGWPKYNNGKEIQYTVVERNLNSDGKLNGLNNSTYTVTYGGNVNDGFTVTNTLDSKDPEDPTKTKTNATQYVTVNNADDTTTEMVKVGDTITYEISYFNHNAAKADVVIIDTLQNGLEYDSQTSPDGTVFENENGTLTWTISDVAPLTGGKVSVTVKVTEAALGTNVADPKVINNATVKVVGGETQTTPNDETTVYHPALTLKKELVSENRAYTEGETITYKVTVTNSGNVPVKDIVIDDALIGGSQYTFTGVTLLPGQSVDTTYTHTVTADEVTAGKIVNKAFATGTPDSDNEEPVKSNEDEVTVATGDKKVVTLTAKSATYVYDGQEKTVTGFEGYDNDADEFEVTVDGEKYTVTGISASGSGKDAGEYENTPVKKNVVVTDEGGKDVTSQFTVILNPGTLTITKRPVTLTSDSDEKVYDGDPLTNKNVSESKGEGEGFVEGEGATYNVTGSQTLVGESDNTFDYTLNSNTNPNNYEITKIEGTLKVTGDLEPEKTSDVAEGAKALLGQEITYTITVKNVYDEKLTNVTVEDNDATIVTGTGYTVSEDGHTATIATLEKDATVIVTAKRVVTEDDIKEDTITNTATVTARDKTYTPSTTVTTDDPDPSLSVEKKIVDEKDSYTTGDKITYQVTVKNIGNLTITGISLTDAIKNAAETTGRPLTIGNGKIGEDSSVDPASFTLAPEAEAAFTYTYTVDVDDLGKDGEAGKLTNQASVSAPNPDPDDPDDPIEDESDEVTVDTDTVITVTKKWEDAGNAGGTRPDEITLKLMNGGDVAASKTVASVKSANEQTVSFIVPALEDGSYTADEEAVDGYSKSGDGFTITNSLDEGEETKPVKTKTGRTEYVTVDGATGMVAVDSTITYEITYYNHLATSQTITITDELDSKVDFVSATDGGSHNDSTHTVTWEISDVAPLTGGKVTLTVKVNNTALESGVASPTIENQATVTIGNTSSQTETDKTTVYNPAIEVKKDATSTAAEPYKAGDVIEYTVTVENTGNVDLPKVSLEDSLVSSGITGAINDAPVADVTNFALAVGEKATFTYTYTVQDANLGKDGQLGTIQNKATAKAENPNGGADITDDDDANVATRMLLEITVYDKTERYSGSVLYGYAIPKNVDSSNLAVQNEYSVTGLASDHTANISYTPSWGTAIDTYDNGSFTSITVEDTTRNNVTDQYDIRTIRGKLEINGDSLIPVKTNDQQGSHPALGTTVTYTITVSNVSAVEVNTVIVSDPTADSLTIQDQQISWTPKGSTELVINTIPAGATVSVTATYTIQEKDIIAGKHTNTATVQTLGWLKEVSNTVITEDAKPALEVKKSVKSAVKADGTNTSEPYTTGDVITYEVTVTNIGNMTISGIKLTDAIRNLTDENARALSIIENGTITGNPDDLGNTASPDGFTLAPNAYATFTYTYKVQHNDTVDDLGKDGKPGKLTNTATATATVEIPNPEDPSNPTEQTIKESDEAEAETKTVVEVTKKWVDDNNKDGKRPTYLNVYLWKNGDQISTKQLQIVQGPFVDTYWGEFIVEGLKDGETFSVTEDDVTGYIAVIDNDTLTITNVRSDPKKEITAISGTTLTYNGQLVKVGETITYEITYYNTTSEDATVTVTDKLPTGVEFDRATDCHVYDDEENTVTWTIEGVPAASQGKVTLTVRVTEDAIPKDENGYPTTAKPTVANTAVVQIGDGSEQKTDTPTVEIYNPALKVEKTAEGENGAEAPYKYGDEIKYTVTVSNIGNVDLTGIKLEDTLAEDNNLSITGTMNGAFVVDVENFDLEAGQSATFTYTYTVTAADLSSGKIENTATASAPDPDDPTDPEKTITDEDSKEVDTVDLDSQLAIEKTALGIKQPDGTYENGTPYKVDDVITYQVVVSNEGTVPYNDVTLSDSLVNDALSGIITKADGNEGEAVTSTEGFTLGVGEKATFTYTYTVTAKDVANGSEDFKENGKLTNTATVTGTPEGGDEPDDSNEDKEDVELEPNSREITVTKKWLDGNGNALVEHPESAVVIVSNEVDFEEELTISTQKTDAEPWSATLDVPKYAEDGSKYAYDVGEQGEKDGEITVDGKTYTVEYEASEDNSSFTVTNTRGDDDEPDLEKTVKIVTNPIVITDENGQDVKYAMPGDQVKYTITYANHTSEKATITVEDILPAGLTYVKGSSGGVTVTTLEDGRVKLTWVIPNVAPFTYGQIISFNADIAEDFKGFVIEENTATVNIGGETVIKVISDPVPVYNPMLKVEKKALGLVTTDKNGNETVVERDRYVEGDTVRYEVTVTNIGNTDIDSVTVHDAIKVNDNKGDVTDYPVTLTNDMLKPNETATVTYTHTFTSDDVTGEGENRVVKNVASANGTTPEGVDVPESNEDEKTVKIGDEYAVEITVENKSVEYTGKEQSGYTVPTDKLDNVEATEGENRYTVTGLENGDKLIVTYTPSKGTYVGEYDNGEFEAIKVVDQNGNDVTGQYSVKQNPGNLTITGDPVEPVKTSDVEKDAKALLDETITYTITVKNVYQTALTDVVVSDDNATIIEGEGYTVQNGKALIATLGVGKTVEVKAQRAVTEDDIWAEKITNTAYVWVDNKDYYPTNTVTIETGDPTPELKVEKTVTSFPKDGVAYKLGEVISYQVVVTNIGNVTVKAIEVKDTIGETVNLDKTIDELEPAQSETFTYTYTVTEADLGAKGQNGMVHNVATATAPDPTHPDDPDKTVTDEDDKDTPTDPADPSLEVEKTVLGIESGDGYTQKDVYTVGDVITFSVSVKNTGNVTVEDIRLTDAISNAQGAKDLTIGEGKLTDGQEVNPAAFTLAPEAEAAFTYTYTVTVDDLGSDGTLGKLTNKAKAGGTPNVPTDPDDPDDPDPTEDEDEKTVDTAIKLPIAANDNTVDYDGQPHGENGYTYDENALEDGHTLTSVTVEGEKTNVGRYPDELKPNGFEVTDGSGNDVTDHYYPIYTNGTLTIQTPNVEVTKTADKKTVRPDGILTYTVTVTNKDEKNTGLVAAAKGVTVKENLPDNASLVESSATQGKFDAGTGVWTVGDIAANAEATLTLKMKVSADALNGDKVKNSVVATVPNDDPKDPDPEDETETEVRYPILTVAKTIMQPSRNADGEYVVREGDTVRYEIKVTNIGQGDANTIVLKDVLPDGLQLTKLSTSNARNVNGEVVWTIPSLKAGGYAVLSIYAVVTDKSITGKIDRNVARITGENGEDIPEDEQPTGESEEITVRNPKLEVEKSVDNTVVYSGKDVNYTIKVTNTGAATAYEVWMKDDLPAGLRRESEKLNGSIWSNQKGLYKISSLAPGESVTIVINATVTAAIGSVVAPNVAIITGENGKDIPEDEQPKGESEEVESVGVKVFFIDWNGRIIAIREVPYGGSAVPPADPTRIGWDFSYWDGVWKNVTQNQYVYARYTPRTPHDANTPISGDHYGIILDADIPLAGGYMSTVGDCFD